MLCDVGSFIWVKYVEIGVSENYANDGKNAITCPRDKGADCNQYTNLKNIYHSIGSVRIYNIEVPDKTVPCNGTESPINFIHITFSCIEGKWQRYQYTAFLLEMTTDFDLPWVISSMYIYTVKIRAKYPNFRLAVVVAQSVEARC